MFDWKLIFDLKKADFDVGAIRSELSQMRYQCSASWNRRVDIVCFGRNSYCKVLFEVLLDEKYKVVFRSEISTNGFDKINDLKIFVWSKDNFKINEDLVLKIVKLKPRDVRLLK